MPVDRSPYLDTPISFASKAPTSSVRRRWNILALYCYSHDGKRRDVDLLPGAVNIITGNSRTGKSALADLIDYVMGSSECNIPGRVFDASSWVAVLWTDGTTKCFIARRVPERRPKGTDDFVFQVGALLNAPTDAAELNPNLGRDLMLNRFESLLGIGDVTTEVFGAERTPVRVSFRNAMPYLLQDASHINNRSSLVKGLDSQQRQHLLDTLPYYLGVVDEESVAQRSRLRWLRAQIAAADRREKERRSLVGEGSAIARSLLTQAVNVGLTEPVAADSAESTVLASLRTAASRPNTAPELFVSDDELQGFDNREQILSERGSSLRMQIESLRRVLIDVDQFGQVSEAQGQRLRVVELMPTQEDGRCPLCTQELTVQVEGPALVRRAAEKIRDELLGAQRERPKLDGQLAALETERSEVTREISEVRRARTTALRAADEREQLARVSQQRLLVVGAINLYLQNVTTSEEVVQFDGAAMALRREEQTLSESLDPDSKREVLEAVKTRLSSLATEIAKSLPMEPTYIGQPIDINLRTLSVGVVTAREREDMRAIGSDENCQTLHVAALLALHRVFRERSRPVPGFILFDQLSRPYYPPTGNDVEAVMTEEQPEVASLKRYFDALFEEVRREADFQVLVLEHAYFSDDRQFVAATRERWVDGRHLIPDNWPVRA